MTQDTRIDRAPFAIGVALMVAGVGLALARFDLLRVGDLWPFAVVAAGIVVGFVGGRAEDWRSGLWIALVGGWLAVNTNALFGFRWWSSWPLLVMAHGALQLLWPSERRERSAGLFTLVIGFWMLVSVNGWFGLHWGTSWPILLVLAGIGMVTRAIRGQGKGACAS